MTKLLLQIIIILLFSSTQTFSQVADESLETLKCFDKCKITQTYNNKAILTLEPLLIDADSIVTNEVFSRELSQKWVKKKADKNCLSSNPDDCLVWCLVENNQTIGSLNYYTINQTFIDNYIANPNNFQLNVIETNLQKTYGTYFDLKEVVCKDVPNYDIILDRVTQQLDNHGYKTGKSNNELAFDTRISLEKYQKKLHLPIGCLDLATLQSMKIISEEYQVSSNKMVNEGHSDQCVLKLYFERTKTQDTLTFNSTAYIGNKLSKLNYADYINLSKISSHEYDSNNSRHAVVLDSNYDKLYSKSPQDFMDKENTVIYDVLIRPGGIESFECLCPDDPNYSSVQTQVEKALSSKGYQVDNTFSETTKRSLAQFQLKNNRPIGVLDFETLDLLGVEY